MSKLSEINKMLGIKESYKAPDRIMELMYGDKEKRDGVFKQFLEHFDYDLSFDWFHEYFQEEHADRKNQKHDYTPESVAKLVNQLTTVDSRKQSVADVASGTGGLLITRWYQDRMASNPFTYRPSDYLYHAEELSDRSLPFLLFNLSIRGMNATVVHGDVLTRESYGVFFVQNDHDDHMQFSSLNVMPYTKETAKDFGVKFIEKRYDALVQTPGVPKHVVDGADKTADEGIWIFIQQLCGIKTGEDDRTPDKDKKNAHTEIIEVEKSGGQLDMFDFMEN